MDFFQRLGNFFGGKGWVNDEEKRRKEQQAQPQPIRQPQPQQVQQPQLNGQSTLQVRPNIPWANQNSGLNQSQPKVNLNPLEQANQANQQLNQNNQPKPQVTTNDAPKMLTPEGQQDWVNKQNQQIQIQNAVKQPIQQQPQPIQQPKPQPVQPQQVQQPKPELQSTVASPYRSSVLNSQGDSIARALDAVNKNIAQYKTEQATRNDAIDNKLRARGVSEPEILNKRQERIRLENEAHVAANEARQSQNMANMLKPVAAIAQPIDSARRAVVKGMDNVNKWIDSYDDKAGFQVDSPGDYVRFAGKLVPGMIQGAAEGPEKLASAVVGKRMTEDGRVENLNGMQRLGSAADGAIDLFGVPFGASGQLVKSALKQGGKEVAKEAVDQAVRKRVLGAVKNITSGAVKEGAEETVQSLAGDLADDGKINTDWKQHAQAGALGALGGVMMGAGGKAISTLRNRAASAQPNQPLEVPSTTTSKVQAVEQVQPTATNTAQHVGYSTFYRRPVNTASLRQAAEVSAVNTQNNHTHPIQSINVNQTVETAMPNASPALKQAVSQNISNIQHGDTSAITTRQQTTGKLENYLIEQATQNVQNTVAQDVRYKLNNTQQSAIDYRLSQDYVAPGDPKAKEIAEYLRKDIEQRRLDAVQARAEGKENFARQIEGMIVNQEQTLKEFEQKAQGVPSPAFRGEEIDLDNYREFNERPTDADIETDQLIDIASEKIADDLNEALKLAGLNDDIRVEHSTSHSSEANYIEFYDDANDNNFTVRIANHYKAYSSGSGDLNITLSDPEIRTFADVADRVHEAFRDFVDSAVNSDTKYKLSPEQEAFFKDSKIRDENGNLKTVYHGTKSDFDEFNRRKIGSATDPGLYGAGFYFSDYEGTSRQYGDRVIKAHLNIKNPLNLGDFNSKESLAEHLKISPDILSDSSGFIHPTTSYTNTFSSALRYAGYDGVIIPHTTKGTRGNEIVALDPEQIKYINNLNPTDNPDMRYKLDDQMQELASQKDLLARHLQLTGDERLVFNEWQNEMQRKALGYYDPNTDKINLNKLSEDTLNHELGHKLLERADNKQELLDTIRESYGDDYLIRKYGKEYGDGDINLLAEEQLADGFSDYYNGILNGEDKVRLGAKLGIPQRVLAVYDRITEAIRGLIGKQDIIKQFYAQMETGKFRNTKQQVPGGDGRVRTMSIDPNKALETIKKFDDVLRGIRRITKLDVISHESATKIQQATGIDVRGGASIELTNKNAIHIHNRHIVNPDDSLPLSDYDIAALPEIIKDPDTITKEKVVRGVQRIKFEREMKGNKKAIVEVIKKGNALNVVTYFNDSSSGRPNTDNTVSGYTSETGQLQSTNLNDSVANNIQNVNTNNRYQHPLQETIDNIQNNPKPKMTKELRQAIDSRIAETNPELFADQETNIMGGGTNWNIPRIHVDDLKHYLGSLTEDIPVAYRRRTGKRDIDTIAQEMGYDEIDDFVQELQRAAESRRRVRENKQMLAELRKDPETIALAQQDVEQATQERVRVAKETKENAWNELKDIIEYRKAAMMDGNNQDVADANREITRIARQAGLKQQELRQFITKYGANMIPETGTVAHPAESGAFTNVPMEDGHLLTKGNLYEQTKPGILDNWTKPFRDGDYEYRVHTKRSRDGKKSFTNFERRYIYEDGKPGDWVPTSRAAYIWKSQTNSINKVGRNEAILKALEAAKQDGEVQEFMAYKNPDSAGGVAVVPLVGEHSIDGGFVRNPRTGEIEGNYIQVTPFGVVHQVNGKFDVIEADHLTNSLDKSKGGITDTFNRLVEKNIQDKVGQKLLKDLYYQKTEAYANYADEIENLLGKHAALAKHIDKARPRFAKSKKFWEDVGLYTEGKFPVGSADENMNAAFTKKYGPQAAERVKEYDAFMRNNYDAMISNLNSVRRMYGKEEIPYLKNYMPHIQKRSNILGRAVDKLLAAVPTGVRGDMEGQARGEIPASIAGLSADFKPTHKFNANEKRRFGGMMSYEKDPRKAFEYYADVMLYNTHMEPVIARGRQIESSMRAIDMAKKSGTNIDPDSNLAKGDKISSKATIAVQNFVNEMAGKSSSLDRPFIDQTNKGVQFIQRLESINGANKILGNLSSTLAQTLNLPETVRDNGLRSTGHAFLTAFDKSTKEAMRKSPFLRERYTDTDGKFTKSQYQKFTNGISVVSGMNLVEKKFIQLNWAANYYSAQRKGLTGYQLIKAADQATERAVGGRGVGAMPQVYKSTLGKMFLQFTYETNESWKNNVANVKRFGSEIRGLQFKDAGGTATRAAEAFAVAYGMNMLMKLATGSEPLANMYDAIKDVLSNDADDDGEDDKLGQKMARVGSELAKLNPIASASLNIVPKSEREKIFGKTSDLGRFDGATGVAQTVANLIGAGYYSTQGDNEKAQKNLQGLIPVGNQIKKTTSGIKVLQDGGDVYTDKNGKEHTNFEVDSGNAWNQAKALLFGKNALRPDEKSATTSTTGDDTGKTIKDFERGLKKGTYKIQDGLLVNKSGNVQRNYYKSLAEGQGVSDEAYYNWMKAYNIDNVSTTKKEFNSSNDILNKLENGEEKVNKAKSAVDILMGKHKDLPDWVRERYYQESGYTKEQIEYGAMTTHKEVSLMDNYWRQKAQESSHEELMQALTNGRRKSITGQMFAKNGVINKLRAEGYITKWEAKALNAAQFDVDGNRITKEGSGSSSRGGSGRGRGGRGGRSANSGVASIGIKAAANISSSAPKASQTSVGGMSINQIGQNLISKMNTQKQVNAAIKKWNAKTSGKNTRIRTKKA
nr:MAG TPA: PolyVal ADP-Ribosyltransferase [Caudoviricetes sp.]